MVTMNPKHSSMHTPMRCFRGICSRKTIGIGRTVVSKSETELMTPPPNMTLPSLRQRPFGRGGKIQYAFTGLESRQLGAVGTGKKTYEHSHIVNTMKTRQTDSVHATLTCNTQLNHWIPLSLMRR